MPRLYEICLRTGNSGADATGTVEDKILGHYFAAPYATLEPELCFVLDHGGSACGYILGTQNSMVFAESCEKEWWPKLRGQYDLPDEGETGRTADMIRALHRGYRAPEWAHDYPAHLHIDILPIGQGQGYGRQLIKTFENKLRELQVPAVHFGVGTANEIAIAFYQHLGFHIVVQTDSLLVFGRQLTRA